MENSIQELINKANQGDINSQILLGYIYQYGDDGDHPDSLNKQYIIEKNIQLAEKWYLLAAEQNDENAQINLARLYEYMADEVYDQYYEKALYWLERSANLGNLDAQILAANYYEYGKGVEISLEKTVYWYEKAANNGGKYAKYVLAFFYGTGQGVEFNCKKAVDLYQSAYDAGVQYSSYELGRIYEIGDWVKQDINKARSLYFESAKYNYIPALLRLIRAYICGELNLEKNKNQLLDLMERAKTSELTMDNYALEKWEKDKDE